MKRRYTLYQDDIWPPFPRERDRNPLPFRAPLVLSMFFFDLSTSCIRPLRLSTRACFLVRWSRVCGWRICEKQKQNKECPYVLSKLKSFLRTFAFYSSIRIRIFVRTNLEKYSNPIRSSFERTTNPKIEDSWMRISTLDFILYRVVDFILIALFDSCVSLLHNGKEATRSTQGSEEEQHLRVCMRALRRRTSPSPSFETWEPQGVTEIIMILTNCRNEQLHPLINLSNSKFVTELELYRLKCAIRILGLFAQTRTSSLVSYVTDRAEQSL